LCECESSLFQIGTKLGVGGRRREQHKRRGHDVMDKAGGRDFLRAQAAADVRVALKQQNRIALAA
jgi:hypothetical protein